jgi:hypothetical protein
MPRELFVDRQFSDSSRAIIERANQIIAEYQRQGFTLTLRQLYYQFVARGVIPNQQTEYKRLGSIINDARLAGLVDWLAIEDRTRNLATWAAWSSPGELIEQCARSYNIDRWAAQPTRVEVWVEKEALVGVIDPICREFKLPSFACRGYSSQSEQWRAGKRFATYRSRGQQVVILHLGDHDPSGIDMTRDNAERLAMFARAGVDVRRLALNMDQVERYNPPPNPAKLTDSRATGYIELHGNESWELDALEPSVIADLIRDELTSLIDEDRWRQSDSEIKRQRAVLAAVADRWGEIAERYGDAP